MDIETGDVYFDKPIFSTVFWLLSETDLFEKSYFKGYLIKIVFDKTFDASPSHHLLWINLQVSLIWIPG